MSAAGKLVVLISGRGSNLRAILSSPVGGQVAAAVACNAQAAGLEAARSCGVAAAVCDAAQGQEEFERQLTAEVLKHAPNLIALAGFMRVLSANFVRRFGGRIVNIHPSLLPLLPGLHTHRRALQGGHSKHGCSVHWVTEKVDGGEVIAQAQTPVLPNDDEETLAARVLALEHELYPRVLAQLLARHAA